MFTLPWKFRIRRESQAEKVQRASDRQFRSLFETMPDPAWIIRDHHFIEANAAALKAIGYEDKAAFLAVHPADISPERQPDGESSFDKAERILQSMQTTPVQRFDWVHKRRDGHLFPVEVTLSSFEWEGQSAIYCVCRNMSEREQLLDSLQNAEAYYQAIFNGSGEAIMLGDQGGFTDCNARTLELFGFDSKAEFITMNQAGLSTPFQPDGQESSLAAQARITAAFESGYQQFEWRHCKRDGTPFDAEVTLTAINTNKGKMLQAIVRDVGARKEAERRIKELNATLEQRVQERTEALTRISERLELALRATRDGLWDWNLTNNQAIVSEGYWAMLGYTNRPLEGQVETILLEVLHPDDRERVMQQARAALEIEGHYELEFRLRTQAGGYRWILSRGRIVEQDASGQPLRAIGTHIDITERKAAEERLRESEERLRLATDGAELGIWYWDLSTSTMEWTDRCKALLALPAGQDPSLDHFYSVLHPDDKERIADQIRQSLEGHREYSNEYRVLELDGNERWIGAVGRPYYSADGSPRGMGGIVMDVTERKIAQAQLESLNQNLEQTVKERTAQAEAANAAKSLFLAHMSHEIRTPMNAILGFAQVLAREDLTPEHQGIIQHIHRSGRSLLGIINDILDWSKIEAGQMTLTIQPLRLATLLEQVDSLLGALAREKGLELRVEAPALSGLLLGDALRLEQVLINLTGNAIKFTRTGCIVIRVRTLAVSDNAARLRFEVEDKGIGMSKDALANLFQPFSQADSSITRRFGGTGLGLSISKQLVELMGGDIGANSIEGQGSLFWFEVPFVRSEDVDAPKVEATPAKIGPRLVGLRLLVVDDNQINLLLAERALINEGAVVVQLQDGQQAIEYLQDNPSGTDLVLMDIQMPVMDGLTATRAIRKELHLEKLPIIALSAGVLAEEKKNALDAGFNDFLLNPCSWPVLGGTRRGFKNFGVPVAAGCRSRARKRASECPESRRATG